MRRRDTPFNVIAAGDVSSSACTGWGLLVIVTPDRRGKVLYFRFETALYFHAAPSLQKLTQLCKSCTNQVFLKLASVTADFTHLLALFKCENCCRINYKCMD